MEENKDITAIIEELQEKVNNLEKENEVLKRKMEAIESIWLSREKY
jgi:hypothetical protein